MIADKNERHYLSEMSKEEVKKMILYPSALWSDLYDMVAQDNKDCAIDLLNGTLGRGYSQWTDFDNTSYSWWLDIKPGQYAHILDVDDYDYFPEDDVKEFKELQKKVAALKDKVDNLEDCDDYYDKIGKWEDEADELADKALQIVVKLAKQEEEVTDDQIVDMFINNEMGDIYYYLGDDKSVIYQNVTKSYKTGYKEEQ